MQFLLRVCAEIHTLLTKRLVALIMRCAVRFDPVDRMTFYSGIVRRLAPIRAMCGSDARRRYSRELNESTIHMAQLSDGAPG
jgi:hypothetical protein